MRADDVVTYGGVETDGIRKPVQRLEGVEPPWPAIVDPAKWEAVRDIITA